MSEDSDLKRMFDAQRRIDETLAPSFGDTLAKSLASPHASSVGALYYRKLAVAALASVVALSIVVFFSWSQTSQTDEAGEAAMSQTEMQRLNHVCDSLLAKIRDAGSDPSETPNLEGMQEMEWPTGTDSLIPFATVTMNTGTSP